MRQIAFNKDGDSLAFAEYGAKNGFPVLIQHGLIASIQDYHLFDRLIELGARLICIARPGYGESSPYIMKNIAEWGDSVSALIEELHLSRFDILGMSSGAPYSYALGNKFQDKVRNIYIFSGTPALCDAEVLSAWPYPVNKNATIPELEALARELFFSNLTPADLVRNEIKDSRMNHCFGIAQDLKIRCLDWGFELSDVGANVFMQHSRFDGSVPLITAERTAKLLPNCRLIIKESDVHFSPEALDEFIITVVAGYLVND